MKRIFAVMCICLLLCCLPLACGEDVAAAAPESETTVTAAPTAAPTAVPTATPEPVRELHITEPINARTLSSRIMDADTIETVEIEPGTVSNADIASLLAAFPFIEFRYSVKLGDIYLSPDVTALSAENVSVAEIAEVRPLLKSLKTVHLSGAYTPQELSEIRSMLPGLELTYRLSLYGKIVDPATETLDLSEVGTLSPNELAAAMPYLTALKTVMLGFRQDRSAAEAFQKAVPSVECIYSYPFTYLGRSLTTDAETLDLSDTAVTDLNELRRVLSEMPNLTRVEMLNCGQDDATMADLCDAFPNIRFIWEIDLGYWGKLRTDATAFTTRFSKSERAEKNRMTSEKAQYIRYCTDLIALDLGHQKLTDISFLEPLTKLRVLILADNYITDIGVLQNMTELEYFEIFMNRVEDLSPLAGLEHLQDLNICSNKVTDYTPIYGLKTLRRFWYAGNKVGKSVNDRLRAELPDCQLNSSDYGTDGGWRFSSGKTRSEREQWKNAFFEGAPRYE